MVSWLLDLELQAVDIYTAGKINTSSYNYDRKLLPKAIGIMVRSIQKLSPAG